MDDAVVKKKLWERTRVTNLVRNSASGNYYARVKVNGKLKWRTLKTKVFTVAEARVADKEKALRTQGRLQLGKSGDGSAVETKMAHYIACYQARVEVNSKLKDSSRNRVQDTVKTLLKTWPELPKEDVRHLTAAKFHTWARIALKERKWVAAPNATSEKSNRVGMSVSNFNKCVDALRAIMEIAVENGMAEENHGKAIERIPPPKKKLDLPSVAQFEEIARQMAKSGTRWAENAADLARLLAFSGARLKEATRLRWSHLKEDGDILYVPGTKSEASEDRPLAMTPSLKRFLQELRARRGEASDKAPIARVGSCLATLKSACLKVRPEKPPMTHHDLRHYFATRCLEAGVDVLTLSKWLGHSDGGTLVLKTYGHLRQEHSIAQAAKVIL